MSSDQRSSSARCSGRTPSASPIMIIGSGAATSRTRSALAVVDHGVEDLGARLAHLRLAVPHPARREALVHELAALQVGGVVHVDHHAAAGPVGADAPGAREHLGAVRHVLHVGVAGDAPDAPSKYTGASRRIQVRASWWSPAQKAPLQRSMSSRVGWSGTAGSLALEDWSSGRSGRERLGAGACRPARERIDGPSRQPPSTRCRTGSATPSTLSQPGRDDEHVIVALPSFSLGESLLSHYGDRIPALEHRYLLAMLVLNRIACDLVLVVCQAPTPEVLDYYFSLIRPERRRRRPGRGSTCSRCPTRATGPIAEKLLDRPDLIDELRRLIGGTARLHRAVERHRPRGGRGAGARRADQRLGAAALAARVQERGAPPVQGGGRAGGGRAARTFARSTTSSPPSRRCGAARPHVAGVVIKHDDSGAGDGNQVIDLRTPGDLRATLEALPEWYLRRPRRRRRRRGADHRHAVHHPERADRRAARSAGWWCSPPTSR